MIVLLHQHRLITGLSQPKGWGSAVITTSVRTKSWEGKSGEHNQHGKQGTNLQPGTPGGEWKQHASLKPKSWKSKL